MAHQHLTHTRRGCAYSRIAGLALPADTIFQDTQIDAETWVRAGRAMEQDAKLGARHYGRYRPKQVFSGSPRVSGVDPDLIATDDGVGGWTDRHGQEDAKQLYGHDWLSLAVNRA